MSCHYVALVYGNIDYLSSMLYLLSGYLSFSIFFFFNDTATTEIYTLSLHDALPILLPNLKNVDPDVARAAALYDPGNQRSEEHTSELQSLAYLVCRLLLEKKKKIMRQKIDDALDLNNKIMVKE